MGPRMNDCDERSLGTNFDGRRTSCSMVNEHTSGYRISHLHMAV